MSDFWLFLKHEITQSALAGLAGGIVSAVVEWENWPVAIRQIVVGMLCAIYLSPWARPVIGYLMHGLSLPEDATVSSSAFLTGIFGMVIVEVVFRLVRSAPQDFALERERNKRRGRRDTFNDYDYEEEVDTSLVPPVDYADETEKSVTPRRRKR